MTWRPDRHICWLMWNCTNTTHRLTKWKYFYWNTAALLAKIFFMFVLSMCIMYLIIKIGLGSINRMIGLSNSKGPIVIPSGWSELLDLNIISSMVQSRDILLGVSIRSVSSIMTIVSGEPPKFLFIASPPLPTKDLLQSSIVFMSYTFNELY